MPAPEGGDEEKRTGARTVALLGSYAPSLILFRGPLIAAMVARGHRVVAMAPAIDADVAEKLRRLGAEPREVPLVNSSLNPLASAKTVAVLTALLREVRPDVFIGYTIKPVTLGSIAARRAGVGRIVALITGLGYAFTEGGGSKRRVSRAAATLLYRLALRCCGRIIFQNPDDRDFFRKLGLLPRGAEVALVKGSGIDLQAFAAAGLPGGMSFLMISRFLGDKGIREYAAASRRLKARYPEVEFRLAGYPDPSPDGLSQREIEEIAKGGVDLLGRLDDVRPAIAAASVYVLPSYREGTPRSVLEALAMARPVVTTDAPGCRETVEDGVNGLLVPPRDTAALADAMERLILDPARLKPMARASRALAERNFDVHAVNRAILDAAGL
ncbi:MAG TPA: glycosyltransferase family 4 protein [Allosphingosinicella sp.]|nr:glycosyltransferase family 4 protein [Allosphingosinicella sp.]